jgi:hypothetical protein
MMDNKRSPRETAKEVIKDARSLCKTAGIEAFI